MQSDTGAADIEDRAGGLYVVVGIETPTGHDAIEEKSMAEQGTASHVHYQPRRTPSRSVSISNVKSASSFRCRKTSKMLIFAWHGKSRLNAGASYTIVHLQITRLLATGCWGKRGIEFLPRRTVHVCLLE
jgi:hypothetical protein